MLQAERNLFSQPCIPLHPQVKSRVIIHLFFCAGAISNADYHAFLRAHSKSGLANCTSMPLCTNAFADLSTKSHHIKTHLHLPGVQQFETSRIQNVETPPNKHFAPGSMHQPSGRSPSLSSFVEPSTKLGKNEKALFLLQQGLQMLGEHMQRRVTRRCDQVRPFMHRIP